MSNARESRELTHDEARLWLNDHCGKTADISLQVDLGEYSADVISALSGELRHWREITDVERSSRLFTDPREDIAGLYYLAVGRAEIGIDVTGLDSFAAFHTTHPGVDELRIDLNENVTLSIAAPALGG